MEGRICFRPFFYTSRGARREGITNYTNGVLAMLEERNHEFHELGARGARWEGMTMNCTNGSSALRLYQKESLRENGEALNEVNLLLAGLEHFLTTNYTNNTNSGLAGLDGKG